MPTLDQTKLIVESRSPVIVNGRLYKKTKPIYPLRPLNERDIKALIRAGVFVPVED